MTESACRIPMVAEELCRMQVMPMPTRMPMIGLEKVVSIERKTGLSRSGSTAADIAAMPVIRIAKPIRISPS